MPNTAPSEIAETWLARFSAMLAESPRKAVEDCPPGAVFVVDSRQNARAASAGSILVSRRRRRAKTDKIDAETLVRTLLAYKRGEPRVCSMVRPPTPEEEDHRRICRERKTLIAERVEHVNRIKGLLFTQGVGDYEPLRRN